MFNTFIDMVLLKGRQAKRGNLPTTITASAVCEQWIARYFNSLSNLWLPHNNNNNNNLKYKDLTIEIQRMRNVKTRVIPVIIGATGTVSKSFRKYVSNIPGNHEVRELQKTAILGTAHILRKVLM
jgi:hypothetical protein